MHDSCFFVTYQCLFVLAMLKAIQKLGLECAIPSVLHLSGWHGSNDHCRRKALTLNVLLVQSDGIHTTSRTSS
jgi:hypothetical protein